MLKAGGVWNCHLVVPDNIRQTAGEGSSRHGQFGNGPEHEGESVTWIIEVASQVLFSTSASVHYEVVLARDEKSLNLGSVVPVIGGQAKVPEPGRVSDFQSIGGKKHHTAHAKGVFSRAIQLKVEDTAALWNTPKLPGWDDVGSVKTRHHGTEVVAVEPSTAHHNSKPELPRKQKKVHLVVLTHGLHSNLGADMLFLKESIDAGVRQAKIDAKARRAMERAAMGERTAGGQENLPSQSNGEEDADEDEDDDEEEVIVRGFSGNATKTEKGIKWLGKRLANFVLSMTYPDQPFLPTTKVASEAIAQSLKTSSQKMDEKKAGHKPSHTHEYQSTASTRAYKITKISFIAHSLGGLVQTYAIAYIQKHSPTFFELVEPINFITLASPFLGLNHENPLYVKFALDFGLVGRTGQDLGLTWRAPTIARNGWGAIVGNLGENAHRRVYGETQPESKPLLRILPTGPAHTALKRFRNRTVYSNVVNDGIVPLRTSCLLFLDWQGLGRVEKARREVGLVETVVGFGWAELTGANVTSPRIGPWRPEDETDQDPPDTDSSTPEGSHEVPQPPTNATLEDDQQSLRPTVTGYREGGAPTELDAIQHSSTANNPFSGFLNLFRSSDSPKTPPKSPSPSSPKQTRIYQRSQTLKPDDGGSVSDSPASPGFKVTSGHELDGPEGVSAPPKTTFFESAGDLLNPKLPSVEYLIDPSKRHRTIFHDRIYHPSDIPPPPLKKRPTNGSGLGLRRKSNSHMPTPASTFRSSNSNGSSPLHSPSITRDDSASSLRDYLDNPSTNPDIDPSEMIDSSQMRVEEKIARAYHRGLSWRKVLVKLEPDAHNNMIVRRMFANAFGWPVVHHLVEAHFSDSAAARTRDEDEDNVERAKHPTEPPDEHGAETTTETKGKAPTGDGARDSVEEDAKVRHARESAALEAIEATDMVSDLPGSPLRGTEENPLNSAMSSSPSAPSQRPCLERNDSVTWSDRDWNESGDESEDTDESRRGSLWADKGKAVERSISPLNWNWTEKIVGKGALHRPKSSGNASAQPQQIQSQHEGETGCGDVPAVEGHLEERR
ncbi:putative serine esterase-domain-containing protein [Cercophora scortea]|uniref:Serine esterase-domain-containing protein n=1 Tax=Cercophora scortea TaxID=314031 RepID=A0AAE0IF09_9PEZI|nr:putative serine esterase-domain-containing protein [Cercophora scortea]